ncbi:hypothetical protein P2318_34280 [Myxococcaceae bacterium GXIMD 01537]
MHATDICSAILVTTGNRALREPSRVRWDGVEELMGLSLRAQSPHDSRATVVTPLGERAPFQTWLAHAPPTARLWLVPRPPPTEPSDADALPPHIRAALHSGGLCDVLVTDGPHATHLTPRQVRPPLYDKSGPQLLAFIRGRAQARALEAALARELELPPGPAFDAFLKSRTAEQMEDVLQRFQPLGADVEYSALAGEPPEVNETEAWNAFFAPPPGALSLSYEYLATRATSVPVPEHDVPAARAALASALEAAQDFAQRHGLASWRKHFHRCLLRLSLEPQPLDDVTELLLLNALPTPAVQLAACALSSDVFGGMGSWNDLPFSDGAAQAEYQALSTRLFSAVHAAVRASVNSSAG